MEVVKIADEIQKKIDALDTIRATVRERANAKAKAIAEYDKQIAITLIKLSSGKTMTIDEHKIEKPSVSVSEKIAKGICWQEKLNMEQATASYSAAVTNLDVVMAQLNALQSIYRHLSEA
jgi:cell division septum initiation protein DivIVA